MSTSVYRPYQDPVYSPAFSEPPSPSSSPMSTGSDPEESEIVREEESLFRNRKPEYPTKYHEMLQPLHPVLSVPVETIVPTHSSSVNIQLQEQFDSLLRICQVESVERFLRQHSENIDINRYNSDGQTPLHQACVEGNLALVRILVQYGANCQLTTKGGFSPIHLATFSGNTEVLSFVISGNR